MKNRKRHKREVQKQCINKEKQRSNAPQKICNPSVKAPQQPLSPHYEITLFNNYKKIK